LAERHQSPAFDDGFVDSVKAGRIEIVAAVDGFDGDDVLLADGSRAQPDVVIAATGYRRGLEPLVGISGCSTTKGRHWSPAGASTPLLPASSSPVTAPSSPARCA
jgi:putative flavoprotein involved in K+ transport